MMCRFALHTGLRGSEVRNLRWEYEEYYDELGRPLFFVPASEHKNDHDRVVVLSDKAWEIIEARRGISDDWVFANPATDKPFYQLHSNQWKAAWKEAGLPSDGFVSGPHNLRHTLGARLRRVAAPEYIIAQFLGHITENINQHYSAADLEVMIQFANKADNVKESPIFRKRRPKPVPEKVPAGKTPSKQGDVADFRGISLDGLRKSQKESPEESPGGKNAD